MTSSQKTTSEPSTLSAELKAEQALGLIGLGLMKKMSEEGSFPWNWPAETSSDKADLLSLKQRLELISLAINTGAPLSTAEVTHLLGARPGSAKSERGGLVARRISRNVWKLSQIKEDSSYWRN